jgi:hypothetical protein
VTDDRDDQVHIRVVLERAGRGLRWSLRSHPLTWWVTSLVAGVTAAAIALGSIHIQAAASSALSNQRADQLDSLISAVATLTFSLEDEQDAMAIYIGEGRPIGPDGLLLAQGQLSVSNLDVIQVTSLARQVGPALAPRQRAALGATLSRLQDLSALRRDAIDSEVPALAIIDDYALVASQLLALDDQLAASTADPTLSADFAAFSALAGAEDQGAQQRAILDASLAANQYQVGDLAALSAVNAQEAADLTLFDNEATTAQQQTYQLTVAGQQVNDAEGMLQEALDSGQNGILPAQPPDHLFVNVQQSWHQEMTFQLDQMRVVETSLLGQAEARSAVLHSGAARAIAETLLEMAAAVLTVVAFAVTLTRRRSRSAVVL